MFLSGTSNTIMCYAFSTTLKKARLWWFTELLKHSSSYFCQLKNQFLAHFSTSKVHKKTNTSLINIKQGKDEPHKNYLARFNCITLEIKDLPLAFAMYSILIDLKSSDFSKSLAKRPTKTMTKLLAWSTKFINMERGRGYKMATWSTI